MNVQEFLDHTQTHSEPDSDWHPALKALWHAEKGDWETAHMFSQLKGTKEGAWVHANLHRDEGVLSNARYWYEQAGKPEATGDITEERREILSELLRLQ